MVHGVTVRRRVTDAPPDGRSARSLGSLLIALRGSLLAREVGGLWAAQGVVLSMGFLQAVAVARMLGPERFGTVALIITFTTLVFNFLDPNSQDAVVKYVGAYRATSEPDKALAVPKVAYAADVLLGLAGIAIVVAAAPLASAKIIRSGETTQLLIVFAVASACASPAATSRAILTTFREFPTVAALQAVSAVARTAMMVGFVAAGWGVAGAVYATGISIVAESACAAVLAHRVIRANLGRAWWSARRTALGDDLRGIIRFMIYTDLTSLVAVFAKEADIVVLGFVRGPLEAGYYRLARSVAAPITSLVVPLQQVVYPRLAAMAGAGDDIGLRKAAHRYTVKVGAPIAALSLIAVLGVPFAVPVVAGADYRPAVGAAMILLAGAVLVLPFFWIRPMLLAGGHIRFFLRVAAATTAVSLIGYFVLGELLGPLGIALSRVLAAGFAGTFASVVYFVREGRKNVPPDHPPTILLAE